MFNHQKVVNYARALFQIVGTNEEIDQRQQQLEELGQLFTHHTQLLSILSYPGLAIEKKLEMIEKILEKPLEKSIKALINILIKQKKIGQLRKIAAEYHKLVIYHLKEIDVEVTTVDPLHFDEKVLLKKKLEQRLQQQIEMKETIDPAILGGMTILVHNQMLDLSIKGKLTQLKKQLLKAHI